MARSSSSSAPARRIGEAPRSSPAPYRSLCGVEAVAATLRARGIEVSSQVLDDWKRLAGLPIERLMTAAVACTGEADFPQRIGDRRGYRAEYPVSLEHWNGPA